MMAAATRTAAGRGAALLLVLWLLVLLTGLISVFALTARTEGLQGRYLGRSTLARYAAEAGIEVASLHLQGVDPTQRSLVLYSLAGTCASRDAQPLL